MLRHIISIVSLSLSLAAFAWGQKGHDVTAYIAEQHLTPTTKQKVNELLDGRSLVYWANWLDNASHTPEYAYTKTWHYKNIEDDERYEEAKANPSGDVVTAIKAQQATLSNTAASHDEQALALKIITHIVGDMHQPLHMGRGSDLGGNRVKVTYFRRETNLHSIWDSALPESAHKWSYSEWQQQIDRADADEQAAITAGTVDDWAKESMAISKAVYRDFRPGINLSYDAVAAAAPVIESQLLKAGLRLAHLLNTSLDPNYSTNTSN